METKTVDMESVKTVADLIDALGGGAALARALFTNPSTITECKRRNSLPVKYWYPTMEFAEKEHGIKWLTAQKMLEIVTAETGV